MRICLWLLNASENEIAYTRRISLPIEWLCPSYLTFQLYTSQYTLSASTTQKKIIWKFLKDRVYVKRLWNSQWNWKASGLLAGTQSSLVFSSLTSVCQRLLSSVTAGVHSAFPFAILCVRLGLFLALLVPAGFSSQNS